MAYNLALDSGGSKVRAILYDENFYPLADCTVGSMRPNSTPEYLVKKHIHELINALNLSGKVISNFIGCWETSLLEELSTVATIQNVSFYEEYDLGLYAAGIYNDGYLAVSGTGANMFAKYHNNIYSIGGYGSLIADEGSGYWISREAFIAAIRDVEDRGKKTILKDLIAQDFGGSADNFQETILSMYKDRSINYITRIASCAPLVSEAANSGDPVAYDILCHAGRLLAKQLLFLCRKENLPPNMPVALSGGVWLGHEIITSEFSRVLRQGGMTSEIIFPHWTPIMGAILYHYHCEKGKITPAVQENFKKLYAKYQIIR